MSILEGGERLRSFSPGEMLYITGHGGIPYTFVGMMSKANARFDESIWGMACVTFTTSPVQGEPQTVRCFIAPGRLTRTPELLPRAQKKSR